MRGLAAAGFRVLAVARDPARAQALTAWIGAEVPGAELTALRADLALMADVRRVAEDIRARAATVQVLVNNAGLFRPSRELTSEGRETTLAVNHLAPMLLTRELLPALSAAPGGRVVNVGSAASDRAGIDPDDLEFTRRRYSMMGAYAQSKLALMIGSFELARRLGAGGPSVNVVHPGLVATGIGDVGGVVQLVWGALKPFMTSPAAGARTTLHVATSPQVAGVTGRYFKRAAIATPNRRALDPALAARVWASTEALLAA